METLIIILAIAAGIIGIAGSILPGIPGPPFSWIGLLILYIWGSGTNADEIPMQLSTLVIWGVVVVIVSVIDYIVPMYLTKLTGGSKHAERGAMIGMLVGIFLTPIGMILGSVGPAKRKLATGLFSSRIPENPRRIDSDTTCTARLSRLSHGTGAVGQGLRPPL